MPALAPVLLRLASAIGPDGHEIVPRLLAEAMSRLGEFEAGEIVLSHAGHLHRFPIAGEPGPLVADDFLRHLLHAREPMRVDEPSEAAPFPQTAELMASRGIRSILALPLSSSGSPAGSVVLARTFSWSLVGLSLTAAVPIAAMAGIALERSLGMAELARPHAVPPTSALPPEPAPGGPVEPVPDPGPRGNGDRRRRRR